MICILWTFPDKKKQLYFIHVQGYAVNTNTKYYVKNRTTSSFISIMKIDTIRSFITVWPAKIEFVWR